MTSERALRFDAAFYPSWWDHHRGGWRLAIESLAAELHDDDGVLFLPAIEDIFAADPETCIAEPWAGFVHQAPRQDLRFPDLERLVELRGWRRSMEQCVGLWTLTDYQRRFLKAHGIAVPISVVPYPCDTSVAPFDRDAFLGSTPRRLVMIGDYLRRYGSLFDLAAGGYKKLLLRPVDRELPAREAPGSGDVEIADRLSSSEYDQLLTRSVVFLDLEDSTANTTVTECMARNTPVLLNRTAGVEEYLGADYPLFFRDLDHAARLIGDDARIIAAHDYLAAMPKDRLRPDTFVRAVARSGVYRRAAVAKKRRRPDLTLLINTYGRIESLDAQLAALARQDTRLTFKLVVWNNNRDILDEVRAACARHFPEAHVISSDKNVYCMSRPAVAPLVESPALLIIDDDVLPRPGYVQKFHDAWIRHGRAAVICARGHRFKPHEVDEDQPETVWENWSETDFFDEAAEETRVHFAHADNLMISVDLLKAVAAIPLPWCEVALVDDYWLSYALDDLLDTELIKIKADDVLSLIPSSDDPGVALFHNPRVHEERIRFYLYHMDRGWPSFDEHDAGADALRRQRA